MSIRIKLILTYVIMVILSVTLITGAGMTIMARAVANFVEAINDEAPIEDIFYSVIEVLADFKQAEIYDPEKIMDPAFMESVNEKVNTFSGFLITEKSGQFNSFGDIALSGQFYEKLKKIPAGRNMRNGTTYKHGEFDNFIDDGEHSFMIFKHAFQNADAPTFYYLAVDVTNVKQKISKNYGQGLLTMLFVIMVLIILPVVLITTKDIIRPLKKLEIGANHIKEGYLDFSLTSNSNNEIGRVVRAFEKMRKELKKSIDTQLQVENNRKELISNISHDLKTPITSIKGYVEGIRDGVAQSPEKLAKYLEVIYHKSEDMDRLIDDLFLFSKLDLHKMPFDMEQVKVLPFYENCLEELHLEYDKRNVVLTSNVKMSDGLAITMDSQKIKRVILNIINNSIKFMDKEERRISIDFEEEEKNLLIKISDNGVGIDQADVEKIFERFYRSDPARNSSSGGSGLGLAIAKQIVEQHGGSIEATSEKGEWTTIQFTLPRG